MPNLLSATCARYRQTVVLFFISMASYLVQDFCEILLNGFHFAMTFPTSKGFSIVFEVGDTTEFVHIFFKIKNQIFIILAVLGRSV